MALHLMMFFNHIWYPFQKVQVNLPHSNMYRSIAILRIHMTSPILGERISAITLTQQRKQWLSVELNYWRSERIHCYF